MTRSTSVRWTTAVLFAVAIPAGKAASHSRRVAHGPTVPSFVSVAPPDGVSPRLILRHRTDEGAAVEADPVTVSVVQSGQRLAEHLHGTPLLASGLALRTELVLDAPTVCAASTQPAARYRLRDIANALRHTFTPGERIAVSLVEAGREPVRLGPTDRPGEVLAWLTASCSARPATPAAPPFDRDGFRRLRAEDQGGPAEAVVWLLVTAGTDARLSAADAPLLAGTGVALLESFTPDSQPPPLAPSSSREPGTYQTDPIVNHLRSAGVRISPPSESSWAPLCGALAETSGRCLLGGLIAGANAMTVQRLLSEGQALFVTPISCLPKEEPVQISTEKGSVTALGGELTRARCDRWQSPSAQTAHFPVVAVVATVALLLFGAAWSLVRRRRAAAGDPP